jgi:hypothetical protein
MQHLKLGSLEDLDEIVSCVKELFDNSVYSNFSVFNKRDTEDTVRRILLGNKENGVVLLLTDEETGGITGILGCSYVSQMFNNKEKTAVELAFWIQPEYRDYSSLRLLLQAYKFWAKKIGCSTILFGKMKNKSSVESYIIRKLN